MLKFKHNLILCQSKWRCCLNTYNSVLTLFAASLFSCVSTLIKLYDVQFWKFTKLQFQYFPLLCNYSLIIILSAINAFSFGRCLVLFVAASTLCLQNPLCNRAACFCVDKAAGQQSCLASHDFVCFWYGTNIVLCTLLLNSSCVRPLKCESRNKEENSLRKT